MDYFWIIVGYTRLCELIGTIVAPFKGRVILGTPVEALKGVCGWGPRQIVKWSLAWVSWTQLPPDLLEIRRSFILVLLLVNRSLGASRHYRDFTVHWSWSLILIEEHLFSKGEVPFWLKNMEEHPSLENFGSFFGPSWAPCLISLTDPDMVSFAPDTGNATTGRKRMDWHWWAQRWRDMGHRHGVSKW